MKRIDMFRRKYGPLAGEIIYRLLQTNAARGRWSRRK